MTDNTSLMVGRTVLITGGTGGIGRATAEGLARLGARVAITGRDLKRAKAAAAEIGTATGNPAIDAYAADLSSQAEVRRLAGALLAAYPRLDVLVNNVGGYWAHRHVTADGLERTFALNCLAPFLLTNLLLDRLLASTPARIVTVSSGAQAMGRIDFDDPRELGVGVSDQEAFRTERESEEHALRTASLPDPFVVGWDQPRWSACRLCHL